MAVLQRKENVQIQIPHSRCKHKKKSCEDKITGGSLTKCCISPLYYLHSIKKIFVPKCNKPDRENVKIQEKNWREKLIWGSIFPLSLSSDYGGQGEFGLQSLGRKVTEKATWGRSNNSVDMLCVITPVCKTYRSVLGVICAEQRWWGGKEKENRDGRAV